ncbi:MAG: HIT family protein [Methanobacterium sp.]|uniref:HIT family protein n=1 Tax=Methanobacterium sp. TaxID=2164 RepID=UPI003C784257
MTCEYCGKVSYGKLITERKYWNIFLAPSQRYLGTCVIAIKRHCPNLSELEDVEWIEFSNIVAEMETVIKKLFNPTLFNWSCFKNAAYRSSNPDPEVHWHLIPRYDSEIEFHGIKFHDPDFGYIPQPITRKVPTDVMNSMLSEFKTEL